MNPFKSSKAHKLDKRFCAWLRLQPSCISGEYSEFINGDGRCVVAHVRRAGNSGTAYKPLFSAVPMTFKEHHNQHQYGESYYRTEAEMERLANMYLREWCEREGHDYNEIRAMT